MAVSTIHLSCPTIERAGRRRLQQYDGQRERRSAAATTVL